MADTKVKNPVVIVGTKAQVESTAMGENDFAVATDVEFYTKEEVDSLIAGAGGGGLESVSHDASLTGTGTADSPLGIASTVTAQINSKAEQTAVDALSGEVSDLMSDVANLPSTYVDLGTFNDAVSLITNDTTEIKETLNGKVNVDLDNITSAAKTKIAGMGMPDYTAGISISSAQTYTPTTNVLVVATAEQSGKINITVKYPDGNSNNMVYGTYTNDVIAVPFFFNAGVVLTLTSGSFKIYPLTKGL